MKVKPIQVFLLGLVIAAGVPAAVGTAQADVSQTPVTTACPAGYERLSVASLEAQGPYAVPRRVDSAGNNNGYVCGLAQPDSVRDAFCKQGGVVACLLEQLGLPHYVFRDDDNPAYQA
jgi:hypothetical protein